MKTKEPPEKIKFQKAIHNFNALLAHQEITVDTYKDSENDGEKENNTDKTETNIKP